MTQAKNKAQPEDENKQQVAAFRKAARQLGCDETEDRFKDALRAVSKAKPRHKTDDRAAKERGGP
jgi:hypothetical protein